MMDKINSVGGTPNALPVDAMGDVSTTSASTGTTATLLPDPSGGGDIGFVIAKLVIENAYDSRKMAHDDKQSSMKTMVAAQDAQVKELHKQAEENFAAAQLQAFGQIGSGICGIGSGVIGAVGAAKEVTRLEGAKTSKEIDIAKTEDQNAASWAGAMKSTGELSGGVFNFAASFRKKAADEAGARAKAAENQANIAKMAVDDASDEIKEARQHVNTALDFLREFEATQSKSMASAIRA